MNLYRRELYHHGIKGQKWGVRRFQNPDGSLTPAGQRRFRNLLDTDEKYKAAVKESTKAANDEYRYVKKSGRLKRGEDYKRVTQELYIDDENFKPIADKRYETWKKARDLGEKHTKEMSKVARSSYNLFTTVGWDRTRQILKDYGNYRMSQIK